MIIMSTDNDISPPPPPPPLSSPPLLLGMGYNILVGYHLKRYSLCNIQKQVCKRHQLILEIKRVNAVDIPQTAL